MLLNSIPPPVPSFQNRNTELCAPGQLWVTDSVLVRYRPGQLESNTLPNSMNFHMVTSSSLRDWKGRDYPPTAFPFLKKFFIFLRQGFSVAGACPGTNSCRPGWPQTHRDPPASAPWVLGLMACTTTTTRLLVLLLKTIQTIFFLLFFFLLMFIVC